MTPVASILQLGKGRTRPPSSDAILRTMGFILDVISGWVGGVLGNVWSSRRGRKRQQFGQIDCGLRVIAGSQEGFGAGWDHDRAFVHSGRLDFGRGTSIPVQVRAVVTDRQRQPRGREAWSSVSPGCVIVELMTDSATLEWAVPADKLGWAIARVQGSDVATG